LQHEKTINFYASSRATVRFASEVPTC